MALIGYGRMGHIIEEIAVSQGHRIGLTIDVDNYSDLNSEKFKDIDVAIEFSSPEAALRNVSACLNMKAPVVSGTTGWGKDFDKALEISKSKGTAFIHSSNFSIGVNFLFHLNEELARQMNRYREYTVSIEEIHHTKKLDGPSGTAITLAEGIKQLHSAFDGWCFDNERSDKKIPVKPVREGTVPGTHTVTWDSEIDTITLRHEAKSRRGFALGAVIAAEFIKGRTGIFTMKEVLGFS
ncbi:MAG TPA: 4-hydroxy-tetrahydrodipicolinate reductase [Bacteroidales bacterium]|nr:4-hydroxy-tetrahydrodipicolinate reductase [Bacteroidales bacterium]HQJ83042.1 4-hydroxy-tetrahydrodipicolinate reductase [Bacteroidales bacterium]